MLFDVAHVLLLSASNCSIHDMKAGMLPVLADSILLTARLYITQSLYVSKNQLPHNVYQARIRHRYGAVIQQTMIASSIQLCKRLHCNARRVDCTVYIATVFFSFFLLNLAELHDYTHSRHIP